MSGITAEYVRLMTSSSTTLLLLRPLIGLVEECTPVGDALVEPVSTLPNKRLLIHLLGK